MKLLRVRTTESPENSMILQALLQTFHSLGTSHLSRLALKMVARLLAMAGAVSLSNLGLNPSGPVALLTLCKACV